MNRPVWKVVEERAVDEIVEAIAKANGVAVNRVFIQCEFCGVPWTATDMTGFDEHKATCALRIECPRCGVQPGTRCARPGGAHSARELVAKRSTEFDREIVPPPPVEENARWNRNPKQRPPCSRCGHLRIFHTRDFRQGNDGKIIREETMIPCSLPGCGCSAYGCEE